MNKKILLASVLALALTSACGNTEENVRSANHETSPHPHQEEAGAHTGGHSGHGAGSTANALNASFSFASGGAKANENAELAIRITDQDGNPVSDFEVNHEHLLHLIIVSRDLSFFHHLHPAYQGHGTFTINTSFPTGGEYKWFADFIPKGGSATTLSGWVKVEGKEGEHAAIQADSRLVKEVDGKEIRLALSSAKSKEDVTLTFTILDARTKQGIDNLEPYLGAVGHVVILSADAEQYIHVHPLDEQATGPNAQFAATFPKSGIYKIWGQFQHNGKVFIVPFVVEIQ